MYAIRCKLGQISPKYEIYQWMKEVHFDTPLPLRSHRLSTLQSREKPCCHTDDCCNVYHPSQMLLFKKKIEIAIYLVLLITIEYRTLCLGSIAYLHGYIFVIDAKIIILLIDGCRDSLPWFGFQHWEFAQSTQA